MVSLKDILDKTSPYQPRVIHYEGSGQQFVSLQFITKGQTKFLEDELYLSYSSCLRTLVPFPERVTILAVKDDDDPFAEPLGSKITLLEYPQSTDLFLLYNRLSKIFNDQNGLLAESAVLFNALLHESNLEALVDIASKLIGNPLIVIDSSYNVLATSRTISVDDMQWKENMKRGYLTYEYIAALNNLEGIKNAPDDNQPFITCCVTSPIRRTFSKLFINGLFLGYYIAIESNSKFEETSNELYLLISEVIAKEVSVERNDIMHNHNQTYEGLLVDILDGNFKNRTVFHEGIEGSVFKLNSTYQLIAVDLSTYQDFNSLNENFKKSINACLPNSYNVYYKKNIVILINLCQKFFQSDGCFEPFIAFLTKNNLKAGISASFTDLYRLPEHHKQAVTALRFSALLNGSSVLSPYDSFKFYDLMETIDDAGKLIQYCCDDLLNIVFYDRKNGTNYFHTIYYYLQCNKSVHMAAERLYIHKNTVSYRIRKIREQFHLNFDDFDQNFKLYYSCLILNYLSKNQIAF